LRVAELLDLSTFKQKLIKQIEDANLTLEKIYQFSPLDINNTVSQYMQDAECLIPYIRNTASFLYNSLLDRKFVLAEGAQGILLDIDHGTYPYVTSSTTTSVGALSGLGVGPKWIRKVIGVTKVFQTRVGEGPFPTELGEPTASALRGSGVHPWDEYGTTTGRPRRVGWLDIPLLKYAVMTSGITELFLTKLDILSNLSQISLCVCIPI
jgi:adenylosuccinate synthase